LSLLEDAAKTDGFIVYLVPQNIEIIAV